MDINIAKKQVYDINLKLSKSSLVIQNFGNASSRFDDGFIIKPSGIDLDKHSPSDMVRVDSTGKAIDGKLKPSSDEPTHRVLYSENKNIGGVIHTHSKFASAFAQANTPIENLGTTHSDFSISKIYVTEQLIKSQVEKQYELNTGKKIIEKFDKEKVNLIDSPGILSIRHGVFAWGKSIEEAYKNAEIIEYLAEMAFYTIQINKEAIKVEPYISQKHYFRKHGPNKYYGQ
jgi:L-ribulose-5-phosphate 4-epimerase